MRQAIINFLIVTLGIMICHNLPAQHHSTSFIADFPITRSSVKITDFTGAISAGKVWLSWTIDGNQETDRFEVERSDDGKTFVMAALVFGTGKTDTDHYRFYEKKRKTGSYYRIKLILTNGTIMYSPVIAAKQETVQ